VATTETTTSITTRSWDSVTRWVMLAWVGVGFVYFVTHTGSLDPALVYLWLGVQAALTVAHIAFGARRPR
jgi:hypothetical protein